MKNRNDSRYIYFMKPVGMPGPIKIGCSNKPARRLIALSVWSPFPLEIIGVAPGDLTTEKWLHEVFEADLQHREWFSPSFRLWSVINSVNQHVPLAEAVQRSVYAKAA